MRSKNLITFTASLLFMVIVASVIAAMIAYNLQTAKVNNYVALTELKTCIAAEDAYYEDHSRYTKDVEALSPYGFRNHCPDVKLVITLYSYNYNHKYSITTMHRNGDKVYTYTINGLVDSSPKS